MKVKDLTEIKIKELIEKHGKIIDEHPDWKFVAERRIKAHILGVEMFGKKLGIKFKNHDADKFKELYVPYIYISLGYNRDYKDEINLNGDEEKDLFAQWATYTHVINNPHHPEYWDRETAKKNADTSFARRDEIREHVIDATRMTEEAILEMCCDWASVGAERGNSPQYWFEKGRNTKWKFTKEQEELIWNTLEKLWPGGKDVNSKIEHEERYFNDKVWKLLNQKWEDYEEEKSKKLLNESFDFEELDNELDSFLGEKKQMKKVVDKLNQTKLEPLVNLQGVGSLQALSFLFSPSVTNYVMNLLDSISNGSYKSAGDSNTLISNGLDKLEFGNKYKTRTRITNNFLNGLMKSINQVNESKLESKLALVKKFMSGLKKYAKTINNSAERDEYLKDVKEFLRVVKLIRNILKNRKSFINILTKTLLIQESEEINGDGFDNLYNGVI